MLTAREKATIRSSVKRLTCSPYGLTERFYQRLFEIAPETEVMFPDTERAAEKLSDTLLTAIQALDQLETLVPTLKELGATHASFGVAPVHYQVVAHALSEALARSVEDWSAEDASAWRHLVRLISDTMKEGAREAQASNAPSPDQPKTAPDADTGNREPGDPDNLGGDGAEGAGTFPAEAGSAGFGPTGSGGAEAAQPPPQQPQTGQRQTDQTQTGQTQTQTDTDPTSPKEERIGKDNLPAG